jgi:hypothetical protein
MSLHYNGEFHYFLTLNSVEGAEENVQEQCLE